MQQEQASSARNHNGNQIMSLGAPPSAIALIRVGGGLTLSLTPAIGTLIVVYKRFVGHMPQ